MAIIQTIPLGKKYGSMTSSEAQAGTNTESQLISAKVLNDQIDEKISDIGLATVATSGSYNDLNDKPTIPTIPTVNNGTLTIQKNGTTVKTFTANSSSNVTADITVPTKVSELTNDSDYATGTNVANSLQEAKNYTNTTTSNMVTLDTSQTISGDKAFSGFLDYLVPLNQSEIPTANTYKHFRYLGQDGLRLFSLQYCSRTNGSRDAVLYVYDKDGGSHGLHISTDNCVIPTTDSMTLGTSNTKWKSVYATNFYGDSGNFSSITTSSQNFLRNIYGNYGTFWRQEDSNLCLMLTASGDQMGIWTSARPIVVNLSTGICNINGNAATATKAFQDASGNVITNTYVTKTQLKTTLGSGTSGGGLSSASIGVGSLILGYVTSTNMAAAITATQSNSFLNISGSSIKLSSFSSASSATGFVINQSTTTLPGTWRFLGHQSGTSVQGTMGLFIRIA